MLYGKQDLDDLLEASFEYYGENGELDERPIPQVLEKDKDARLLESPLKYPGKVATDLQNNRLFISDSNHHRIVWPFRPTTICVNAQRVVATDSFHIGPCCESQAEWPWRHLNTGCNRP